MIRKITILGGALIMIAAGGRAWAANTTTITVTSLDDPGSAGICVLRDAIAVANNGGGSVNGCSAESGGPYQIGFQSGLSGSIKLRSPLTVTGNMTVTGPTSAPGITIDGIGRWQLISSTTGGTLDLENLTFTNGFSGLGGGGIENELGTLTVTNCTFSGNNLVGGTGAGIDNFDGTATVTNSTFSGNTGGLGGGGIYNFGTLTVTNSTFSGNNSDEGGAIGNDGTATVTNSTFSGNTAEFGGAIDNLAGTVTVTNSTLFGNTSASYSGAVDSTNNDTGSLHDTILAGSTGPDCAGITDAGYNLSDDDTCGFSGSSQNNVDALLDPAGLVDNGGPTETIALQSGSPAINVIPPADCTYPAGTLNPCSGSSSNQLTCDQRGSQRPAPGQSNCDIGAYEGTLGSGPIATLSATSLSFGSQPVGTISPHQTVTLTNTGGGMLKGGIMINGDFGKQTLCRPTLSAGQSCTINVAFKPTAQGVLSGTLTLTTNAPGSRQTITLSGTGTSH